MANRYPLIVDSSSQQIKEFPSGDTLLIDAVNIDGGTIDGVTIGGASAGAGTFTTLNATGGGALTGTWSDLGTVTTVDINGGTIDGAIIGGASAAAGTFTDLTASGTVSFSGATVSNGGTVTTIDINGGTIDGVTIGGSSAGAVSATTLTTSSTVTHNGGTANGVAYLNGSKVLTTGSALTFDGTNFTTSANFLINKSSPTYGAANRGLIEINGTNESWLLLQRNATASTSAIIRQNATNFEIVNRESTPLTFGTADGAYTMTFSETGNLGIGTSSPSARLHVTSSAAGAYGGIIHNTSATGEGLTVRGGSTSSQNALVVQNNTGGDLFNVRSDGNVGIGTSSPEAPIDAEGSAALVANFNSTDANGGYVRFQNSGTSIGDIGAGAAVLSGGTAGDFGITSRSGNLVLGTGTTERMSIDSSGNVGIGTSSPTQKLHLVGSGDTMMLVNDGTYNSFFGTISGQTRVSNDNTIPIVFATNSAERMRIDASGNLNFDYNAVGGRYLNLNTSSAGDGHIILQRNSANKWQITSGLTNALQFYNYTAGSESMRITSAGNVGIGTSSPDSPLEIQAATNSSSDTTYLKLSNQGENVGHIDFENGNGSLARITGTKEGAGASANDGILTFSTAFDTSLSERMRIDSSGNVVIGSGGLDVSGIGGTYQALNMRAGSGYPVLYGQTTATATNSVGLQLIGATSGASAGGAAEFLGIIQIAAESDSSTNAAGYMNFYTGSGGSASEAMRIDSSGNLLVGTTSNASTGGHVFEIDGPNKNSIAAVNSATSNPYGPYIYFSGASPNDSTRYFLACTDSTALRAAILSNGGLANYQSNNADLSDIRTKKDITPAPSYWDKIGALEIVTYKYNDQTHDDVNVGVIAQQVETVEPVWVDNDGFGETPEGEEPLKTVYTKDITFAAIKALQEAMTRIETLEAEVAALKGA